MSKNKIIMLPREVVEQAMEALFEADSVREDYQNVKMRRDSIAVLRAALDQPQPDPAPYLYYDPANGDTWTQEAINDGCCLPDGLIALYTKDKK